MRKGDSTPLTEADTALHLLLSKRLDALSPGIPILSEESEGADIADRLSWRACWVVDPLDGTKEFIEKTDQFTINIALVLDGVSELGLISIPCRKEHWLGVSRTAPLFPEGEGLDGSVVSVQGVKESATCHACESQALTQTRASTCGLPFIVLWRGGASQLWQCRKVL